MNKLVSKVLLILFIFTCHENVRARTVDSVVTEILGNNIELKSKIKDNDARISQSRAENSPGNFSVEYSPFFEKGYDGVSSSELIVQQEFAFPTKYAGRSKVISSEKEQLKFEYESLRSSIATDVRLNCLTILLARENLKLLRSRLLNADSLLHMAKKLDSEGNITRLDLNRIKMEKMNLDIRIIDLENEEQRSITALGQLNGGITPDIENLSYGTVLSNVSDIKQEIIRSDLSLKAGEAGIETSKKKLSLAKSDILPDITVGYRLNTEQRNKLNGFIVGASFPLFSYSKNLKAASLEYESKVIEQENAVSKISAETDLQLKNLEYIYKKLSVYDLFALKESSDLLFKSVTLGNMTLMEYFREADSLYEMWEEYNILRNEYEMSIVELGRNLPVTY